MSLKVSRSHYLSKASRFVALAFFITASLLSACELDSPWNGQDSEHQFAQATVIKVKDGDSVILRYANGSEKEARLFGIDAPEYGQPYGREAKRVLESLVLKRAIQIESRGEDRYQRDIVVLTLGNNSQSVNYEMIRLGAAWHYAKYQDDKTWQAAQIQAKQRRMGLWKNNQPMAPWVWRKR